MVVPADRCIPAPVKLLQTSGGLGLRGTTPASHGDGERVRTAVSLRWYLIALIMAVTLPLLGLTTLECWDAVQARRSEATLHMQMQLSETTEGLVRGLAGMTAVAQMLANAPALADGDLAAFRLHAAEVANIQGVDVVLRDPSGAQLVATRVPRGAPPPTLPPEDRQARAAIDRGAAYVSDIYSSGMTHPYMARIVVPAVLGRGSAEEKGYSVEVGLTPSMIAAWLDAGHLPRGWMVSVVGRNGRIITQNGNPDVYAGRGAAKLDDRRDEGAWAGAELDGQPLSGIFTRLPSGWVVKVGATDQVLAQPLRTTFEWLAIAMMLLILGGLTLSLLLVRRINWSAATLERAAWAVAEGKAVPRTRLPVRDLAFVQDALASAGDELAAQRVTERRLLEDVRSARDLLQAVMDGSDDLIFARDSEGRLVLVNQASIALFGLRSGKEALGRRLEDMLAPSRAAGLASPRAEAGLGAPGAEAGLASPVTEAGLASVDGRLFEVGHSPLRDPAGAEIGTISIAREITQRVAEEARLQRLQADLARAGRLSAVAAMGAGLAHELHQPLSAAANFLAVAMRRLGSHTALPMAPAVAEAMAEASGQVLRAGEIVQRLRGFIEEAEMRPTRLAPLLREAAEAAWQHCGPSNGRLHMQLDERLDALVDPVSIQQVVSNLVRNAVDAVSPGGGDVWLVLKAAADGSATVSVMDTGGGIDASNAERLFDVFNGSSKKHGLGVGLAICRTIVAAHGGWISAANHAGGGAAFVFTLPPGPAPLGFGSRPAPNPQRRVA